MTKREIYIPCLEKCTRISRPRSGNHFMWIHLNPVGGIAGDMFIAAILDAFPELKEELFSTFNLLPIPDTLNYQVNSYIDHAITGTKFLVSESRTDTKVVGPPGSYNDIIKYIENLQIDKKVSGIAKAIFLLLAEAESNVHKIKIDELSFHELGEWDSILDIIGASFLINALDAKWSIGGIPLGGGTVSTEHGQLPAPAPATCFLLKGFNIYDDGVIGERVTPTGAAILKFLHKYHPGTTRNGYLQGSGVGFGTTKFKKLANILRVLVFNDKSSESFYDRVGKVEFEVDDQTPEHLSLAMDKIRQQPSVLDVLQQIGAGKKNRVVVTVKIICKPESIEEVIEQCFLETSTLGVRYMIMDRRALNRQLESIDLNGETIRVKLVSRGGQVTGKVESDDLSVVTTGQSGRDTLADKAVLMAIDKWKNNKRDLK